MGTDRCAGDLLELLPVLRFVFRQVFEGTGVSVVEALELRSVEEAAAVGRNFRWRNLPVN